jgi:putative ABC transport system substrate-binding protein
MRRRDFITLAGSAAAWPVVARAQQQGKKARIGFLSSLPDNPLLIASYSAFSDEMRRLGWVENQNLIIEYRYTNDPKADLATQAADLVKSNVDLFVAIGPETALQVAFNATRTIPIAMIAVNFDPIARGYVAGLARPGGNVTGIFFRQLELAQKQVELLTQAFPQRKNIAALYDALSADQFAASERMAAQMNLQLRGVKLENPPYDFNEAFHVLAQGSPQMLLVQSSPYFTSSQRLIAGLAIEQRLPTMFIFKNYVEARRADVLRRRFCRYAPPYRRICRQNPGRREACRHSGRTAHQIRAHGQSENGQINRRRNTAIDSVTR